MNFKKYHVSRNLFDAATAYGELYSNGVVSGNTLTISRIRNFFNENQIGKQITISIRADKVTATRIFIVADVSDNTYNSNSIYGGNTGVMQVTVTPQSTSDYWLISYGSNANNECIVSNIMLNSGSQPLPYEPYSSEVWHDIPHYIHNTSTNTITTLPAVLYPTGTTATVGLKGNAVQSTTPTPQNPVMPNGTGERTAQLFDYQTMAHGADGKYLDENGDLQSSSAWAVTDFIPCNGSAFTLHKVGGGLPAICLYDVEKQYIIGKKYNTGGAANKVDITITSQINASYIRFSWYRANDASRDDLTAIMLNTGSEPLPYEPYGIKIPISSANTTMPVYLGEVQTVRAIKKLVLTGEENFNTDTYLRFSIFIGDIKTSTSRTGRSYCSHYECLYHAEPYDNDWNNVYYQNGGTLYFHDRRFDTVTAFKSYLAAQYAAGTPVTVWYVLSSATTGTVNEPLMKIGDYADTVSNVSIPVTAGGDTISVGTTVQPSEVTVNYKGWHPVADVHERDSGQWD